MLNIKTKQNLKNQERGKDTLTSKVQQLFDKQYKSETKESNTLKK